MRPAPIFSGPWRIWGLIQMNREDILENANESKQIRTPGVYIPEPFETRRKAMYTLRRIESHDLPGYIHKNARWFVNGGDFMRKLSSLFTLAFILTGLFAILPKSAAAQDADPPSRVAR